MKNIEKWIPNKYIYIKGKLKASRNPNQVNVSSRLVADLVAEFYDTYIKEFAKGNLLDLGCGTVPLYETYKPFIKNNICLDWENTYNKNEYLDLSVDLNKDIPYLENEFDTIILSDVLEHIKEPKQLWKEMNRVLTIEGILLMNVPFIYGLHEEPFDYYRYTKHALIAMAEEAGFEVIKIEALGGIPEIFADIISKSISVVPFLGKIGGIILHKLTWLLIKTNIGKKISKKSSNYYPIAYGMIAKKVS